MEIWDAKVTEYEEEIQKILNYFLFERSHAVILTIPSDEELDLNRFQFFIDRIESCRNGKPVFLVALKCDLKWKLDDKKINEIVSKYNYNFVFEQITEDVIKKFLEGLYDDEVLNPYMYRTLIVDNDKNA